MAAPTKRIAAQLAELLYLFASIERTSSPTRLLSGFQIGGNLKPK